MYVVKNSLLRIAAGEPSENSFAFWLRLNLYR